VIAGYATSPTVVIRQIVHKTVAAAAPAPSAPSGPFKVGAPAPLQAQVVDLTGQPATLARGAKATVVIAMASWCLYCPPSPPPRVRAGIFEYMSVSVKARRTPSGTLYHHIIRCYARNSFCSTAFRASSAAASATALLTHENGLTPPLCSHLLAQRRNSSYRPHASLSAQ